MNQDNSIPFEDLGLLYFPAVIYTRLGVQVAGVPSHNGIFRWFKFTLKPPYSIMHDKLQLAIWDTYFWTSLVKFGHKGP